MKLIKTTIFLLIAITATQAQYNIETTVSKESEDASSYCVNVELENKEAIAQNLIGQNIRFFYNTASLSFEKTFLDGSVQEVNYSYEIKSDVKGLNKESGTQLSFDSNMGFINYTITSSEESKQLVLQPYESIHAQTVCFSKMNSEISSSDIVLAADGVSDEYSRAFVQVEVTPYNDQVLYPISLLGVDDQRDLAGLHK